MSNKDITVAEFIKLLEAQDQSAFIEIEGYNLRASDVTLEATQYSSSGKKWVCVMSTASKKPSELNHAEEKIKKFKNWTNKLLKLVSQ